MPIARGAKGMPGILAIPGRARTLNQEKSYTFGRKRFRSPPLSTSSVYITGTTRTCAGVALAGATVQLFRTATDEILGETISDGSGNFSIRAAGTPTFYLVAYLAGAPDIAGTTVNTLVPA